MSTSDLQPVEDNVQSRVFERALEYLKQNVPEEKRDEIMEWIEKLREMANSSEKIDVGDVVADLLDYRKFGLSQEIVEEFLKFLVGSRPDGDKLISGTIEYAKRKIWSRKGR